MTFTLSTFIVSFLFISFYFRKLFIFKTSFIFHFYTFLLNLSKSNNIFYKNNFINYNL